MNEHYPFILEELPYNYSDLEPYIDAKTVEVHHNKHLGAYVEKLNKALEDCPLYHCWSLEKLIVQNQMLPRKIQTEVLHNAGGVYNHDFYFKMLTKNARHSPTGLLKKAIDKNFSSFDEFKKQLTDAALNVFGSGYAWLLSAPTGCLKIITTPNQDTDLTCCCGSKILLIDVWEHAYYLKYLNRRIEYINNIFYLFNWDQAEKLYQNCLNQIY